MLFFSCLWQSAACDNCHKIKNPDQSDNAKPDYKNGISDSSEVDNDGFLNDDKSYTFLPGNDQLNFDNDGIKKKQLVEQFFENDEFDYEHQTEECLHILPSESVQLAEPSTILENTRVPASGKHATLFLSLFLVIFQIGIH